MLFRLIYYSETNFPLGVAQSKDMFRKILEASARHNAERGITGALMFDWNHFLQILEGDRTRVSQTFVEIAQDRRHKHVVLVEACPIDVRAFNQWSMVYHDDKPETKAVFARYCANGRFQPEECSANSLIALCREMIALKPALSPPPAARPAA
jgi:hypothetical protein